MWLQPVLGGGALKPVWGNPLGAMLKLLCWQAFRQICFEELMHPSDLQQWPAQFCHSVVEAAVCIRDDNAVQFETAAGCNLKLGLCNHGDCELLTVHVWVYSIHPNVQAFVICKRNHPLRQHQFLASQRHCCIPLVMQFKNSSEMAKQKMQQRTLHGCLFS